MGTGVHAGEIKAKQYWKRIQGCLLRNWRQYFRSSQGQGKTDKLGEKLSNLLLLSFDLPLTTAISIMAYTVGEGFDLMRLVMVNEVYISFR